MSAGMKRTIDELFVDVAPAAAPPAQAALAAQTALAASPPPLQALMKDPVAASPGSETEEEELVDGICTFNGIRATPPRLLFTVAHAARLGRRGARQVRPALRGGVAIAAAARAWRLTGGFTILRQVHLGRRPDLGVLDPPRRPDWGLQSGPWPQMFVIRCARSFMFAFMFVHGCSPVLVLCS